ncbi:MAG TPA: SDR family oxidoreductase [Acidimicrobiia bacterium]|nr:SDR family oxidoreductase [Acidimicrobiia bacterium]
MARVLITGCSTGFGRAAAVELTKRGHDVVATARRLSALDDLDVADRIALDVDDDVSVAAALAASGPVDALVNNAGFGVNGPIECVPIERAKQLFETNVWGAVRMMQAVVPAMRERGRGVIVNVSSVAGRVATPLGGFYAGSKFALEGISEAAHIELGHFGIRIHLVEPGFFETSFSDNASGFGVDGPPYDELAAMWTNVDSKLLGGARPGPEVVAAAIADAVERDDTPLRVPVGADAELVIATRAQLDDAAFEATMRATLGFTW